MSKYLKNWKTTSAGIVSIVSAIALYLNDKAKIVEALSMLLAGIGLIFAGDAQSEPTEPTA
jgi:hypothetical protein